MNHYDKHIQELLKLLNSWHPISASLREELRNVMKLETVTHKQQLSHEGSYINKAWYSIDCSIASYQTSLSGSEEVIAIYRPTEIFTDLFSFLEQKPTKQRLVVIDGTQLLYIGRKDFNLLRSYMQTSLLLEHYLLTQRQNDHWRMELFSLSDKQKVSRFAERYPINNLPANISASYLKMDPSRFSKLRGELNRIR